MNQLSDNVKALFFAQYLGQEIEYNFNAGKRRVELYGLTQKQCFFKRNDSFEEKPIEKCVLLLRKVEQLTDGELWIAGVIMGWNEVKTEPKYVINRVKQFISTAIEDNNWDISVFQYLFRIGILLPFLYLDQDGKPQTLTVEQIVETGWVRIKE